MRRTLILFGLVICFVFNHRFLAAQDLSVKKADSLANVLVERHKKVGAAKMSMPGYRVQVYFGSERSKALEIKADFISVFPLTATYLVYHQPYFKVRVGDFRTRLEAQGFLEKLEDRYATAFIVGDEVKLPDY